METNVQSAASLAVMVIFALVLTFLYLIPAIVTWWKLYAKAGRPGWAAIVPLYSTFVMGQIGKLSPWIAITTIVVSLASSNKYPLLGFVSFGLSLYMLYALTKVYDRGVGFWLLVIFFPIIGVFMVKNANYIGDGIGGSTGGQPTDPAVIPATSPVVPPVQPPTQSI